jgi:hypothetical protein
MTRKSKGEIEQQLEEIEKGPPGDYPTATLNAIWACDWETVDEERRLERCEDTGQIYYIPEFDFGELEEA